MRRTKIVDVAKTMPPLRHKISDQDFDIRKSYVIRWMLQQDETYQYIWNKITQSGAIKYNPKTHLWQGVDFKK